MRKEIRVGIVGAGMMGVQHAEAIRRVPGTRIVALADADYALAESTCCKLHIETAYRDYAEMLEKEQLDAVHICTPNYLHYPISKAALEKKLHVFCEKPLANTAEETEILATLAEEQGVVAAVNFNYRQNVMVREMRAILEDSSWGKTFMIRGEYIQDWMMYDTDYNWRCMPEINGVSRAIADIGSHWFDAIQYITGSKVAKVYCKKIIAHPQRKKFNHQAKTFEAQTGEDYTLVDIVSEDGAMILFEMGNGIPGILTLSQISAGYKNGMVISIDGGASSMTWEQENPDKLVVRTRENGTTMRYAAAGGMHGAVNAYTSLPAGHAVGWADGLKNSIWAFYQSIVGGTSCGHATFADGNDIVQIVEACLNSAEKNTWVDVERGELL